MRRFLLASCLILPVSAFAQAPRATLFDKNVFGGAPYVSKSELQSGVNTPAGIAGLDANGNVTAGVLSPVLTGSPATSNGAQPLVNMGRFPVASAVGGDTDPFQSPDAFYIGGLPTAGWSTSGAASNQTIRPGSLVVTGQPWGPYNAASVENLLMSQGTDAQNGVCASDWRAGPGHYCGGDGVMRYTGVEPPLSMVTPPTSVTFTATSVTIASPGLSAADFSKLRVGMYIQTNVVNSAIATTAYDPQGRLKIRQNNFYISIIDGFTQNGDGSTTISVSGWDIPTAASHPTNQIPGSMSGDSLDTWFTSYSYPTVFIGAATNNTAFNDYIDYKGYNLGEQSGGTVSGGAGTAHALSWGEVDLRYWANRSNDVTMQGLTLTAAGDPGTPVGAAAVSKDSYALDVNGDFPNGILMYLADDANLWNSTSYYLHGAEGTYWSTGQAATASGQRPVTTTFAYSSRADSTDMLNLIGYQEAYGQAGGQALGAANTSYHLGLRVNGSVVTPTSMTDGGSNWGEIEWNPKGATGASIGLCVSGENCGLLEYGSGSIDMPNPVQMGSTLSVTSQINASGNVAIENGTQLQFIPTDGGYSYLTAPAGMGGLTIAAKTYQGGAANISAYMYQEGLYTPSSSTASCVAGQFTDDADYHYVCVATNTWKRVALSSF